MRSWAVIHTATGSLVLALRTTVMIAVTAAHPGPGCSLAVLRLVVDIVVALTQTGMRGGTNVLTATGSAHPARRSATIRTAAVVHHDSNETMVMI
jgi:hypothetical protein